MRYQIALGAFLLSLFALGLASYTLGYNVAWKEAHAFFDPFCGAPNAYIQTSFQRTESPWPKAHTGPFRSEEFDEPSWTTERSVLFTPGDYDGMRGVCSTWWQWWVGMDSDFNRTCSMRKSELRKHR